MRMTRIHRGMRPEEARALLNESALTVSDLAMMLLQMGDPRSIQAIERGLYHALSCERSPQRAQFVPWSVAALLRCLVLLRRADLGEAYEAHFLAHQRRLRVRRKPGVQYAADDLPDLEKWEAARRAGREAEHAQRACGGSEHRAG